MRARALLVVVMILSLSVGSAATFAADSTNTVNRLTMSYPELDVPVASDSGPPTVVAEATIPPDISATELAQHLRQTPGTKTVFFPDERQRVSPAYVEFAFLIALDNVGDPLWSCTGTMIGPDTVATAAHCLYSHDFGWASSILVVPGADSDYAPLGSSYALRFVVSSDWIDSADFIFDYGLILLEEAIGYDTGWLELGALTTASLNDPNLGIDTIGYPGDKPFGTQWWTSGASLLFVTDWYVGTDLDAYVGQSGSALIRAHDALVFGILSNETPNTNYAVRVHQMLIEMYSNACAEWGCQFSYWIEPETETPDPSFPWDAFDRTWARTDWPIADGVISRTWMWGPEYLDWGYEPYTEAPGGERAVAYLDKSRMEVTYPGSDQSSPWYVTNGLLVMEMMNGVVQNGDSTFEPRTPSRENVAGDQGDPNGVTYWFMGLLDDQPPTPEGAVIDKILTPGAASNLYLYSPDLGALGVTGAWYVPETNHTVAAPFWDFMNSSGVIFDGNSTTWAQLFQNPFYATGLPVTEAYWANVKLAGVQTSVLVQCFERRCLTYTPSNPEGWQVEAGNVGQHYYIWRYGRMP
ncbi:MAG: trypsin-like serine protease [Thermomicrobiales bacterium]|nr:trypsin-like serine protease [Thermomicrobiales bacterium]